MHTYIHIHTCIYVTSMLLTEVRLPEKHLPIIFLYYLICSGLGFLLPLSLYLQGYTVIVEGQMRVCIILMYNPGSELLGP